MQCQINAFKKSASVVHHIELEVNLGSPRKPVISTQFFFVQDDAPVLVCLPCFLFFIAMLEARAQHKSHMP